ncbi:GNAT family N-acetyltransferase [Catellatospora sp. NPDC049609]|uniref:GNAT family N-acetyltransferase n=1 Tax=Catellatospora sp. NPDC049609 TaxID=3155505 RepID=UPI003440318D
MTAPARTRVATGVLDNPAWAALTGAHHDFGQRIGGAARYHPDVALFAALSGEPGPQPWHDLAALAGPGSTFALTGDVGEPPAGWEVVWRDGGVQLVDTGVVPAADAEAVVLTAADVPEMIELVERTRPGPFLPRTVELGTYLGIRRGGTLIAMAGERLRPPGWTEISAVCTDPGHRGQGLAGRLVRAVAAGIRARGETPFLHTAAGNTDAVRLYLRLGFEIRRATTFAVVRSPVVKLGEELR